MKYIPIILILELLATNLFAQNTLLITGTVTDSGTRQPVPFASISIAGKAIGTVSNAVGEFDFHVPHQYSEDTLIVSHVGYKRYHHKIAELPKTSLSIKLTPSPVLLNEIVIREKNLTPKEIVAKAVRSLTLNYATKEFCLQGFFREIEEENGKYVLLTEAAVDLYDKKFDGKPKRHLQENVDVREMRRSIRYSNLGNRDNIGFAIADLIENNDVRYNRGMLNTATNTYTLDTVMLLKDRMVYGISALHGSDSGMLYIDTETYGFLRITMERRSRHKGKKYYYDHFIDKSRKRGQVWFRYTVEFDAYENKLYPRRMHESELNEFYDAATGEVQIAATETIEFIVTNIIPGGENKAAKNLKYGMTIKTGAYHENFWKNYNTLKLTPLDKKLIQDLEKEISLQEQFKKAK